MLAECECGEVIVDSMKKAGIQKKKLPSNDSVAGICNDVAGCGI